MSLDSGPQSPELRERLARVAGPLAIAVVGIWSLHRSWGMWPDVQVDFGRELYVPWRILSGEHLHREIAWFNGPLSAYWNALLFRLFGVGLSTLVAANLVVTAAITALLYRLIETIADRWAATAAGLAFVGVFAFGQTGPVGNYNYVTPYAHELTHGLALALVAIFCFFRWSRRAPEARSPAPDAAAFVAGLVFLTKTEVFAALAGTLVVGAMLDVWARGGSLREMPRLLVRSAGFFAIAPAGVFVIFALTSSPAHGLHALFIPWVAIFDPRIAELDYYRWVLGTLYREQSIERFQQWVFYYLGFIAPAAGLALAFRRRLQPAWLPWAWPVVVVLALVPVFWLPIPPELAIQGIRPLPLVTPALGVASFVALLRDRRAGRDVSVAVLRTMACLFALGIQAKMYFNAQIFHYGFVLMMPATLLWVAALVGWIPQLIERVSGSGALFRIFACAAILAVSLGVVERSRTFFEKRTHRVAAGVDAFVGGPRAQYVNLALDFLRNEMREDETLVVLPEGIMINYLLRRRNPTPFINFMPPEVILYGERDMLQALRDHPPDYVALVHKKTALYGYAYFGHDYGRRIHDWVIEGYRPIRGIGQKPFRDETRMGISILKRWDLDRAAPR